MSSTKISLSEPGILVTSSNQDLQITIPHAVLQSYNVSGLYHDLSLEFTSNPNPVLDFATWIKLHSLMSGGIIEDVRMGFSLLDTLLSMSDGDGWCVFALLGMVDTNHPKGFQFEHLDLNQIFQLVHSFFGHGYTRLIEIAIEITYILDRYTDCKLTKLYIGVDDDGTFKNSIQNHIHKYNSILQLTETGAECRNVITVV